MRGTSSKSNSNADAPKRGPLWIAGRVMLLAAAVMALLSLVLISKKLPDHSDLAVGEMKRLIGAEIHFSSVNGRYATGKELSLGAVAHYTFTVKPNKSGFTIVAIPDDPRQKSLYTDETLVIRASPGTQAAGADSPPLR